MIVKQLILSAILLVINDNPESIQYAGTIHDFTMLA